MKLFNILKNFNNDKNKNLILNSKKGIDFEARFLGLLVDDGEYISLPNVEFKKMKNFKKIKNAIENQEKKTFLIFDELKKKSKTPRVVFQPFGKQKSPDLLLIKNGMIAAIELKFTEKRIKNPVWNSGLPKQNYLYLFGSYGKKDIVFFLGNDLIESKEAFKLKELVKSYRIELKEKAKKITCKFEVYLRPMYNQKNNSWKTLNKSKFEKKAISFLENF